ncbi:hypothetical protein KR009_001924 [Drosophila setifemur]|nr:hypothetical protein KR009_001924 [Drosophila setifemur]
MAETPAEDLQQSPSGLVCLPDDILILILRQLDLSSQVQAIRVHSRFLAVMPYVWRLQCRNVTISLLELELSKTELGFFLESCCGTIHALRVKMQKREHFDVVTSYVYPNLHDFRFSAHSFRPDDADTPKMLRAFPNLRALSPHGRFRGNRMADFVHLEHLKLTHCPHFAVSHLVALLKQRSLKSLQLEIFSRDQIERTELPEEGIRNLEVLHCDAEEMDHLFLSPLSQLKRLRELKISGGPLADITRFVLTSLHREDFKVLELNGFDAVLSLWHYIAHFRLMAETVKVIDARFDFTHQRFEWVMFSNVKKLFFKDCSFVAGDFENLMFSLSHAEVVGFDSCRFELTKYTFNPISIAMWRNTALNLYVNDARVEDENGICGIPVVWDVDGESELFRLHRESPGVSYGSHQLSVTI